MEDERTTALQIALYSCGAFLLMHVLALLVHESCHAVAMMMTGDGVPSIHISLLDLSFTSCMDRGNEVTVGWAGPAGECLFAVGCLAVLWLLRSRFLFHGVLLAARSLLGMGAYLFLSVLLGIGDAPDMMSGGMSSLIVFVFASVVLVAGLGVVTLIGPLLKIGRGYSHPRDTLAFGAPMVLVLLFAGIYRGVVHAAGIWLALCLAGIILVLVVLLAIHIAAPAAAVVLKNMPSTTVNRRTATRSLFLGLVACAIIVNVMG